jgi:protein-L-isoaspartate(D-aspartate) O-methyltransferase
MREVPRHLFVPEVPIDEAYVDDVVITKRDGEGRAISSASAPWIVGLMLDWLDVRPGHRVLEIGAGTGYNAALLAHLVGEAGSVTTVDFDQDTVDRARAALNGAGYDRVNVVCGDGEFGYLTDAPFDRIIVAVGTADLPRAWWEQLVEGGRLVVPLRVRGSQRVIAFERDETGWHSTSIDFGGFMPIRGVGAQQPQSVTLHESSASETETLGVTLQVDEGQPVNPVALGKAMEYPRHEVGTGVCLSKVGTSEEETSEWLELWLAYSIPGYGSIGASEKAVASGLVDLHYRFHYNLAVFDEQSFAYLAFRPSAQATDRRELVVCAHGPTAEELADRVAARVRTWDLEYREARPCIEAYYESSALQLRNRLVVEKKHVRLVANWDRDRATK